MPRAPAPKGEPPAGRAMASDRVGAGEDRIGELVRDLAAGLETETPYGPVLVPSAGFYTGIFAWDSAWHYFFLKEIDASRAAAEVQTLLATADSDGRVPHETRFDPEESHGPGRRLQLALLGNTYAPGGRSHFIDPPVHAWAAADAVTSGSVKGREAADLLIAAARSLAALAQRRTLADLPYPYSHVPVILHPLESGTDGSPQFDEIYGGTVGTVRAMVRLGRRLTRLGWDPAAVRAAGIPVVFDITVVAFYLVGLVAVRAAAASLPREDAATVREALPDIDRIDELVASTLEAFLEEERGFFTTRWIGTSRWIGTRRWIGTKRWIGGAGDAAAIRTCRTATLSGVLPLLVGLVGDGGAASNRVPPGARGDAERWPAGVPEPGDLVERHLAPGGTFRKDHLPRYTMSPVADGGRGESGATEGGRVDSSAERREGLARLLWRGPCSWMNMNYCVWRLLRRYGREEDAAELARRAAATVVRVGPYEYFHADGSEGGGAHPFSWNGLVLPMVRAADLAV